MPPFIPGAELARFFYLEAVRPILDARFSGLVHSAALVGTGSEVLGFDTEMSSDHSWGPRVLLFMASEDHARRADDVRSALAWELPLTYRGYTTHFEQVPDDPGSLVPAPADGRPINHLVRVEALAAFGLDYAGVDLLQPLSTTDWLCIPEQILLSLAAGPVFHDGLDILRPMQERLAYYPRAIWLYLLCDQWQRIGQEEPFVGRAGIVGDDAGSAIIAARLVRDVMRLCFLMEKRYAPYAKWFGSAFARLDCAPRLLPALAAALQAKDWQTREAHLATAFELAASLHNELGITGPIPAGVSGFHTRPFRVIHGRTIAEAIWESITDPEVLMLPFGVGKVDQWIDSTDVLSSPARFRRLAALYSPG